jgi:hypothetical protein
MAIVGLCASLCVSSSRQATVLKRKAYFVRKRVSDLAKTIRQAKHKQYGGIDAYGNAGISALNPRERVPANEGSLCDDGHRQSTTFAGYSDVRAQLLFKTCVLQNLCIIFSNARFLVRFELSFSAIRLGRLLECQSRRRPG